MFPGYVMIHDDEHFVCSQSQLYFFLQNIFYTIPCIGIMACLPILIVERHAFFLPDNRPGGCLSVNIDTEPVATG